MSADAAPPRHTEGISMHLGFFGEHPGAARAAFLVAHALAQGGTPTYLLVRAERPGFPVGSPRGRMILAERMGTGSVSPRKLVNMAKRAGRALILAGPSIEEAACSEVMRTVRLTRAADGGFELLTRERAALPEAERPLPVRSGPFGSGEAAALLAGGQPGPGALGTGLLILAAIEMLEAEACLSRVVAPRRARPRAVRRGPATPGRPAARPASVHRRLRA